MNDSTPQKWTKRQIKTLTQIIASFYLENRPVSDVPSLEFLARFRAFLAEKRLEIIKRGLRVHIAIGTERAQEDDDLATHFERNPQIYKDGTAEMVARFRTSAADGRRGIAWTEKLLAQVEQRSLPPEVAVFDPTPPTR